MSTAVVGFDVGSLTSYIGAAKGGGVEVLANEASDRRTPSCVAFNGSSRFLGAAADQQMVTNLKNTITTFSRLIGKMASDPIVKEEREYAFYEIVSDSQGRAAIKVNIDGNPTVLLPEQVLAMHLHKLAEISEINLGTKIVDVVLGVPTYYTDRERRAFLDGTRIAGLNCMRLVNETTAIGIAYGLTKKDLPASDQPSRNVVFVSLGNSNLQVSVTAFNNGKMKVLSTACDPNLGGRNFDMCIFHHVAKEISDKYKLKVMSNKKACVRLLKSCERLKKVMSTNAIDIPINVECLMEDTDVSSTMNREFFEKLCQPLLRRSKTTMEKALQTSGLKPDEIYSVELVGGGTRIPALKKMVYEIFGVEGSTTLNADEAVARGCAFLAAICSPAFKVREFNIVDACSYAISLHWKPTDELLESVTEEEVTELTKGSTAQVFQHLASFPASKQLKFFRKSDFSVSASYANPETLHVSDPSIGTFHITNVVPTPPDNLCQVRIKARVNSNGIFSISNAVIMERVEKEVEVPIEDETKDKTPGEVKMDTDPQASVSEELKSEPAPPETSSAPPDVTAEPPTKPAVESKPKTRIEIKTVLRPRDVPVNVTSLQLTHEKLLEFTDFQAKLNQADKIERDRQHMKNSLEEYVYHMREKLETCLSKHTTNAERGSLESALTDTETWIYDEGEDAKRSVLSQRLEELKNTGERLKLRYSEAEQRPGAVMALSTSCEHVKTVLDKIAAGGPEYDHLTKDEIAKLETTLKEKQQYLNSFLEAVSNLQPTSDPTVLVKDLYAAKTDIETLCNPIICRPKPPPPPPAPAPISEEAKVVDGKKAEEEALVNSGHSKTSTTKPSVNTPNGEGPPATKAMPAGGEDMDVD